MAALAGVMLLLVVRFAARNPGRANLGPSVFRLRADRLAGEIDRRGPTLFTDPLNRRREVYVNHLGPDPDTGWVAVRAYAGPPRLECLLRWNRVRRRFVDPCTKTPYPPDGAGLTRYRATVSGGFVHIDLRQPEPPGDPPPAPPLARGVSG